MNIVALWKANEFVAAAAISMSDAASAVIGANIPDVLRDKVLAARDAVNDALKEIDGMRSDAPCTCVKCCRTTPGM